MQQTTPTHSEIIVREPNILNENKATFELYQIWKSLPVVMLSKMRREDYLKTVGFDDEVVMDLAEIRTQKEFAEKYDLSPDTLTDWNKKLRDTGDQLGHIRNWANTLTKNLVMAMYMHALKKGDPQLYKLWLQTVAQWSEKQIHEVETDQPIEFHINLFKKPEPVVQPPPAPEKTEPAKVVEIAVEEPVNDTTTTNTNEKKNPVGDDGKASNGISVSHGPNY